MIALYFDLILGGKVNVARDQHLLVEIRICISVIVCGGDDDYTTHELPVLLSMCLHK